MPDDLEDLARENRELKEEVQECHEILDRVGADQRETSARITQPTAQRLPARILRLVCEFLNALLGRK